MAQYIRGKEIFARDQATTAVSLILAIEAVVASIIAAVVTGGLALPAVIAAATVLVNIILAADGTERDAMLADEAFWDSMSCCIYCVLRPRKDIDEALRATISGAIGSCDYTSGDYDAPFWYGVAADFFLALPVEVIRNNVAVGALVSHDCSGCDCGSTCSDTWVIFGDDVGHNHGTILDYGDGYVHAKSDVLNGGNYYLLIRTGDENECCVVPEIELLSGVYTFTGWTVCGTVPVEGAPQHSGIFGDAVCINYLQLQSATPFEVNIHFAPCP
jgi:hypothetical protein